LKVAIVGSAYPLRGGLAAYNERLAREFQLQGHDVTIHTFSLQYPSLLFPGKTQYADWDPPADLDIRIDINTVNPLNWYRVGRKMAKMNYDLVIFKFWIPFVGPSLGTIAKLIRKNKQTKVITILDNVIPHEKRIGDRAMTKYYLKQSHAFVAMSESVLTDLKQFQPDRPTVLSPHPLFDNFGAAVDRTQARASLGIAANEHCLLFFGFIRDYKGLDLAIEAMADPKIKDLPVKLVIAGEFYTDEKPYLAMINQLGLQDKIVLKTDFIPDSEVTQYFSAADLVLQPYKDATQSGITQIAYHFEKPMVVTNVGGLPEIVPHGKAGYVVEPTPPEIANAIHDFFTNERASQLIAGVQDEKKKYSWSVMLDKILALYEQCI
jgi:glycosyltransferase involved in cell wall biosynthesis